MTKNEEQVLKDVLEDNKKMIDDWENNPFDAIDVLQGTVQALEMLLDLD